ncbi:MAG: zinc ribbon domain-containing protein, partial [Prochloraceae cyanobacterium]
VSRRIVDFADWLDADLVLEDLSGCRQTMKQSKKSRSDNGESRHTWAYYDLQTKLEYKQAMNGRVVHIRPAQYTSKTSSVNGVIGKRNGHWFKCSSGANLNADFNAGRNLALWDYRTTPIDFEKAVSVMGTVNLSDGVFGSPPNSMNIVNGRGIQFRFVRQYRIRD